ncbi:uncharacterized protein [Diabrotica undecimpunctata]|uniref:uncharacterized protein n=1 Tax=Diabrotica undecimpunctata TaxID=50387 RepID=UPI003B635215
MLSTLHTDNTKEVLQSGIAVEKPETIINYNGAKSYIDLSDQIKAYSHCLRRGTKWHRKLTIELLLGSAVVNAFLVYKEVTQKKLSITDFNEKRYYSLLRIRTDDIDEHKPEGNTENHALEQTNSRLRCIVCYGNSDGRKVATNKSVRSK